ncbi:phosphotransferase enzyme family protein [Lentiprolixibacter aurantiacus]|uniref:Aminoglycoside phosphotransferase family protein n=1 Tax=Lentiprolixibacter aurantiacus TaxID=2993939 RepID=A0AAE3SN35_9FLAO|nr:aminoglycoside phosphotransferase family protein [Lentiprolixibacter aurantiacus]MCX2718936.1 aminoglycoside phosphotransferase family protein [Lentiprolixibacter aurantiacus]
MGQKEIHAVLSGFPVPPHPSGIRPLDSGYINRSFAIEYEGKPTYVLQQLNSAVFEDVESLMENLRRALTFLQDPKYCGPELIPAKTGDDCIKTPSGEYWRLITYVPDSFSSLFCTSEQMASETGRILGLFHQLLGKADPGGFKDFLPGFQSLRKRLEQFDEALSSASAERLEKAKAAIGFAQAKREPLLAKQNYSLPLRVCHNDTKMSNFLFSKRDGKGLCLIDLDTVMPGYFYYDFGDALRTVVNPSAEDERDLDKITFNRSYCEAFIFALSKTAPELNIEEIKSLPHGAQMMPYLHGVRALTDFLLGDRYYQVSYPSQNLDRSLALFRFASLAEEETSFLEEVIGKYFLS